MSEDTNITNKISEKIAPILTLDNLQKYVLGVKKSGQPRAVYDIIKDYTGGKKGKKKKKKGKDDNSFSLFVNTKKKKKKRKHWHI